MDRFFSVVIPTRNRPELCADAVASAAEQEHGDCEVIVVDDGSADCHRAAYAALTERYGNVRLHRLPAMERGHGPSFARNVGAGLSASPYVAFLDDDDVWVDGQHLYNARHSIECSGAPDLYYTNQVAADGTSGDESELWVGALARHTAALTPVGDGSFLVTAEQLFQYSTGFSHLNTTLVSRRLFTRVRGFDTGLRYEPDRDFALRTVSAANKIVYRPATVARHNVPDPTAGSNVSTSSTPVEKCINQLYFLEKAICFSKPIVARYAFNHKKYTLKRMAGLLADEGDFKTAARYAWQALALQFSLKWLSVCVYLQSRAVRAPLYVPRSGKWYGSAD